MKPCRPAALFYHGPPETSQSIRGRFNRTRHRSPEYLFGLEVQRAMMTNGVGVITQAFDLDALYHRFVPTLPISDDLKQQLYALPRDNAVHRLTLLNMIASDINTLHLYFLRTAFLWFRYGSSLSRRQWSRRTVLQGQSTLYRLRYTTAAQRDCPAGGCSPLSFNWRVNESNFTARGSPKLCP